MGAEDPFWDSTEWREGHIVIGAYNSARDLIRPDGDLNQVLEAALRTHTAWERSRELTREGIPEPGLRVAQAQLMSDYARELSDMGATLRRWDGLLPVPFSEETDKVQVRASDARKLEETYRRVVAKHHPETPDTRQVAAPTEPAAG